ncbi:MAG TPA: hypothetical protein VFS76_04635 [Pyrinomonadaceae bacterium]|nr:hypothetical protein [Pyrinomonadaceae bacterium]
MNNNNMVNVTFTHPRENSRTFGAEVSLQCTAQLAVQGLMQGNQDGAFLDTPPAGRPYELVLKRTSAMIPPNMTFAQAGVIDHDVIEIRQAGQGAFQQ